MSQSAAIVAIVKKDLMIWLRNPVRMLVTIVPALVLLLILVLQGAAVQGYPIAIVNHDHGSVAHILLKDTRAYKGFIRTSLLSTAQAQIAYKNLQVAAVLTIPHGFSTAVAHDQHPTLRWQVRNFNNDSANDLRRALPDIINQFLAQNVIGPNPIHIQVAATDLHAVNVGFIPFELVAVLVVLLLQASLVSSGLASVNEWENGSVKELLLSPAARWSIILGKILAGVVISDLVGTITVGVASVGGLLPGLTAGNALMALLISTLLAFFGSGVGVALASTLRTTEKTSLSSLLMAFYLFFLSGGIVAYAYLPGWVQAVARFIPNTYAVDALRNTLLYHSGSSSGTDIGVLAVAAVGAVMVGIPAMRRGL